MEQDEWAPLGVGGNYNQETTVTTTLGFDVQVLINNK